MTIPTYRDLQERILVLEGKLKYWSGLASLDEPIKVPKYNKDKEK